MTTQNTDVAEAIRGALGEVLGTTLLPEDDDVPLAERHERYDSLAVIDAVGAVEQALRVSIDLVDDDLRSSFASVASIERLVARKKADLSVLDSAF